MQKSKSYKPILIAGAPRSGTTLLSRVLDWHPSVLSFPREIPVLYYYYCKGQTSREFYKTNFVDDENGKQSIFFSKNAQEIEEKKLSEKMRIIFPEKIDVDEFKYSFLKTYSQYKENNVIDSVIAALGDALISSFHSAKLYYERKPDFILLKTPTVTENVACMVAQDCVDAKFIHIIRDPFSRFVSEFEMKKNMHDKCNFGHPQNSLKTWDESITKAKENLKVLGSEKYLIVIYENVISNPERSIMQICHFLNINYDKKILSPTYLGKPVMANSSFKATNYNIKKSHASSLRFYLIQLPILFNMLKDIHKYTESLLFYKNMLTVSPHSVFMKIILKIMSIKQFARK
jgi:hypothetical protein